VTAVAVDPADTSTAYLATTAGKVWRTADGGASWQDVTGDLPRLGVSALALDHTAGATTPTVWVANGVGVYGSDRQGANTHWAPFGAGLPNVTVSDLEFNRRTRTLAAGTYGRGVWEIAVPNVASADVALASAGRSNTLFVFAKAAGGRILFNQAAPGGAFVGWQSLSGYRPQFLVRGGTLLIEGDQVGGPDDAITLDVQGGGVRATLDGEVAQFDPGEISSVVVNSGAGRDAVNVLRTPAGVPLRVTSTGSASVRLGAGSVQGSQGPVTIYNGPSYDTVTIDDSADAAGRTFTVSPGGVTGLAPAALSFTAFSVSALALLAGSGDNSGTISGAPAALAVHFVGGAGNNSLTAANTPSRWDLSTANGGEVNRVSFANVGNLIAGSDADTFAFRDGATVSGRIGGGANTLDYSAYSTSVVVNLQTGFATGVGGGVSGIRNVIGGSGGAAGTYNLLIGSGGNTLIGGTGRRNLLVAGSGASTLVGGDQDDLLLGGFTSYDAEAGLVSWLQLAAYWAGSDDFWTRVANLTTGNGVPPLDATTVFGNGGGNSLLGNGGLALLYSDGLDTTSGFDPSSPTVPLTP
jgi:hypothetical protein